MRGAFVLGALLCLAACVASAATPARLSVCLYFDGDDNHADFRVGERSAVLVRNLLGHFKELDVHMGAVGRFVLRSKEALVAIRPVDGMLCLETMRYADEVLSPDREQIDSEAEPSERDTTVHHSAGDVDGAHLCRTAIQKIANEDRLPLLVAPGARRVSITEREEK